MDVKDQRIVAMLLRAELETGQIAARLGMTRPGTQHRLRRLMAAGRVRLVSTERGYNHENTYAAVPQKEAK